MSDHRSEPVRAEEMPADDFWAERDSAFAAADAQAVGEMLNDLRDIPDEEGTGGQWLEEAVLAGELELPDLDYLAPMPESGEGPDFG